MSFVELPDLAARVLGGGVVDANDEFFAARDNLLNPEPSGYETWSYGPKGKVYDGWETRRRRTPGYDWAVVRLGAPGAVHGVVIDTAHFTGNYPPFASVHATTLLGYPSAAEVAAAEWFPLVERAPLEGGSSNVIPVATWERLATHVRLTIHPDGGVARFRVFGEVVPDPRGLGGRIDLAALVRGGSVVDCSNMFYASPANAIAPGRASVMSDGWETSRRRDDGNDWLVVRLAAPGELHDVVIDTSRFLGNAPGWAALADAESGAVLLARTRLLPDTEHVLRLEPAPAVRSVRLDIYPDGGISRLRVHGTIPTALRDAITRRWLDLLPQQVAVGVDPSEFFG